MKPRVAIIGYGRFGRFAAGQLAGSCRVFVADEREDLALDRRCTRISIPEAGTFRFIVLAVPMNRLPALLRAISPLVRPGSLVIDVCSVKEKPVQWMKQLLPKHAGILGTHPLFGPDSARRTVSGKQIVLCPVRIPRGQLARISRHLAAAGLEPAVMSPSRHDRLMARTLFLTQYVGRGLMPLSLPGRTPATENYRMLLRIVGTTAKDTEELFRDMYRYNRFARTVPGEVVREMQKVKESLRG